MFLLLKSPLYHCGIFLAVMGSAMSVHAGTLPIAETLGGERFDPWNKVKWAAWYDEEGRLKHSFLVDTSLEFADDAQGKPVTWRPEFAAKHKNLFELSKNANHTVEGRGTVIDVCAPLMSGAVSRFYENAAKQRDGSRAPLRDQSWDPPKVAFFANQAGTTNSEGTILRNFTLIGFQRALETHHKHQRKLTMEKCVMSRSLIAVFARGQNVTVRECVIRESMNCGVYGEYASRAWTFEKCTFSDNSANAQAQSFADIVLDACHDYVIHENNFTRPAIDSRRVPEHRTALSLYRNSGETADIREHAAHHISIERNRFDGYHLAVDIAARAGVVDSKDRSLEGRCYTHDITVRDNDFNRCKIGIKINADQNYISDNIFNGCDRDIVVHCVFYKIINQHITQNTGKADVWLWSKASDTRGFSDYCFYQSRSGARVYDRISDDDRLFHIVTKGNVTLHKPKRRDFTATVWTEESLVTGDSLQDMVASGAVPVDVAVADYADHLPGDEIAVIWNTPVSRIEGKDFYTIIIYDQWGIEIDRCGRSPVKWKAIAGGNLIPGKGWIHVNSEAEIAAVADGPDAAGKYPVFIFRRGFGLDIQNLKDEGVVRLAVDNTKPWHDIVVGDFVSGGPYREVAVIPSPDSRNADEEQKIYYFDPRRPDWSGETGGLPISLGAIAAGDFDLARPGDEIAGISTDETNPQKVHLFKAATQGAYHIISGSKGRWASVASGNFDGNKANGDEIVVACADRDGDVYPLKYFYPESGLFKTYAGIELRMPVRALDAGHATPGRKLGLGEKIVGGMLEGDIDVIIEAWGDHTAVLPSKPQISGIPLYWINAETAGSRTYIRTVPLYR